MLTYYLKLVYILIFQEGWTPLHVAIQSRNRDIAKILLVNGADKTRRNKVSLLYISAEYLFILSIV